MSTLADDGMKKSDNASRLASYLGAHPEAFDDPTELLASRFDLPEEFVVRVLSGLKRPNRQQTLLPAILGAKSWLFKLRLAFRVLTHDPLLFVAVSSVIAVAIFLILDTFWGSGNSWFSVTPAQGSSNRELLFAPGKSMPLFYGVAATTLLLHQACYFRHGQVRFALLGGVWVWIISASTVMVIAWVRARILPDANIVTALLLLSYVMFVLAALYSVASTVTSVLGGAYWVRKHEEAAENRSRQELISHLFDLRDRLFNPRSGDIAEDESFWRHWTSKLRPWFLPAALIGGTFFSVVEVSSVLALQATFAEGRNLGPLMVILVVSLEFVKAFLMSLFAFIGGRIDRAILAAILFHYATLPLELIPIMPFGISRLQDAFLPRELMVNLGICVVVGSLAALGSKVEARNLQQNKLRADERAAVLSEIVRTEWQLARQNVNVCVLVVDVVQSSRMKIQADPLEVEYSFREYQSFVAKVSAKYHGVVHSTAGDGAVVAFYDAVEAFEAARDILLGLDDLNENHSRLKSPFRLRIGLHLGQVAGDIGDVQFSEVIDIAAHFESAAPRNGIAVSQTIAEQLPHTHLKVMDETVSGYRGFFSVPEGEA